MYWSLLLNYTLYWSIYSHPDKFKQSISQRDIINTSFMLRGYQLVHVASQLSEAEFYIGFFRMFVFLFGQLLNFAVYYKLGNRGVYYGRELGYKNLPIIKSFPYNVISFHPQYIGSIMSIWSFMSMVVHPEIRDYCNCWIGMIGMTMLHEI